MQKSQKRPFQKLCENLVFEFLFDFFSKNLPKRVMSRVMRNLFYYTYFIIDICIFAKKNHFK